MSKWRAITVEGETYRWKCGRSFVIIQNSEGKRILEDHAHNVKGLDPFTFEKGQYKRTSDGMITPEDIRKAILERS